MRRLALGLALLGAACVPEPPTPAAPGLDPAIPATPGETRAGVVRSGGGGEAALFGGLNAEGRSGDFKLYNDRVRFVIQGPHRGHGLVDAGGNLIDADLVRDGVLGRDLLEDAFVLFGLSRYVHYDSVTVLSDGRDGLAVVRAEGTDVPWPFIQGLLELPEPALGPLNLAVVTDYALAADSWSLQVTTTLTNRGDEPLSLRPRDALLAAGADLDPWSAGRGLAGPDGGDTAALGFVGRNGEGVLSLWPEQGLLSNGGVESVAADLGLAALGHPAQVLGPGESRVLRRSWTLAPDLLTAEAERWRAQGQQLRTVSGTVSGGGPVAGARVWFSSRDEQVAGFALTDEEGAYEAELPAGAWTGWATARGFDEQISLPENVGRMAPLGARNVNRRHLRSLSGEEPSEPLPHARGRAPSAGQTLLPGDAVADFELGPESGVALSVRDGVGAPIPAVVLLQNVDGASIEAAVPAALRPAFGLRTGARTSWGWTHTGELRLYAEPGDYTLLVGHSWRHEQAAIEVTIPGGLEPVEVVLDQVVPDDGWLSVDPHLHASPSFDGALSMEHRLIACAATGVELPVTSEHDRMVDYRPLAKALRLDTRMRTIPGYEVTTGLRGHFNVYPVEPRPLTQINGGAEPWWELPRDTQELFDRVRARSPDALVQVNHPRTPGMFAFAQLDRASATPAQPDFWSWDFETFELLNGGVTDLDDVLQDWFAMLDAGRIRVPMGASDSHYAYIPCGHGRTDVWLDAAGPADVDATEVRDAIGAGSVVVAGGTTLRASLDLGAGPALPGTVSVGRTGVLDVTVQAPSWIQPGTLRVWRNGDVVFEQVLTEPVDATWFDDGIEVEAPLDSWFAVEVRGTEPLGPLWRDFTPFAMTNAFFVDVDGDGWRAPLR